MSNVEIELSGRKYTARPFGMKDTAKAYESARAIIDFAARHDLKKCFELTRGLVELIHRAIKTASPEVMLSEVENASMQEISNAVTKLMNSGVSSSLVN